jgi:acylglycerol lipase
MSNSEAVKYTTEWVRHDGREFYTITCEPEKQPVKATLTLVHGIGEHVDRYEHMIRRFAQAGIKVHAYDQRGFGKTGRRGGTLGDNEGFKKVLDDVTAACRRTRIEGVPHFLVSLFDSIYIHH